MLKKNKIRLLAGLVALLCLPVLVGCSEDDPAGPQKPQENVMSATIGYYDYLDLDTGDVEVPRFWGDAPNDPGMDFWPAQNSSRPVQAVIFHRLGRSIAHLPGRSLESVTAADANNATYSTSLIDVSFDPDRVILLKTDSGAIYKMGNSSEDQNAVSFDYVKLVDAPPEE